MSEPSYIEGVNGLIRAKVTATANLVCYGQNISAGSFLSGLTRGLTAGPGGRVLNTPNAENSLTAMGFGMMLNGISSIFFVKQQDFLLLGMDHLVNSYNVARLRRPRASFTIVAIVVDSGWEGPQSRLNHLGDFCSIARLPGYTISNRHDAKAVIARHLVAPGCRIIGLSQRLFRTPWLSVEEEPEVTDVADMLCYGRGPDATIAAFNFTFPQALRLWGDLAAEGVRCSLFSVPGASMVDWTPILADLSSTRRLIVLDDVRSTHRSSHMLRLEAYERGLADCVVVRERAENDASLSPVDDVFEVEATDVMRALKGAA